MGRFHLGVELLPRNIRDAYQIEERHHASAILHSDFPEQWDDLITVLNDFVLRRSHVETRGGNKSPIARAIDALFFAQH